MIIFNRLFNSFVPKVATINAVPLSFYKFSFDHVEQNPYSYPLLIFHGLFGSKNNWKSSSLELAKRISKPVYAFDLRNHGESPSLDGNLDAMAGDILHFVEQNQFTKISLLGHSLGGRVVSQFAFNWPEKVDKFILADILPVNYLPQVTLLQIEFFDLLKQSIEQLPPQVKLSDARKRLATILLNFLQDRHVVGFLLMSLRKADDGSIRWSFNVDNLRSFIQNGYINHLNERQPFNGKSLLIYGEESHFVRQEYFESVRKVMPHIEFAPIADTGHYLHIEKPQQFVDCVIRFLQK